MIIKLYYYIQVSQTSSNANKYAFDLRRDPETLQQFHE
jgi:hypothetical protein